MLGNEEDGGGQEVEESAGDCGQIRHNLLAPGKGQHGLCQLGRHQQAPRYTRTLGCTEVGIDTYPDWHTDHMVVDIQAYR